MDILSTTDYGIFKILEDKNRSANPKKLIESISKKNMLEENPIICIKDTENRYQGLLSVIDGQNRLKAAEFLKIPIFYIISEKLTEKDIPLCQVQTPWKIGDFVKFFRGENEDYDFVYEMVSICKIPPDVIVYFCSRQSRVFKKFRDSDFKLSKDKSFLRENIIKVKEISDFCSEILLSGGRRNTISSKIYYSLWALVNMKNYDHIRMMNQCNFYRDNLLNCLCFSGKDTIKNSLIIRVYNYKKTLGNLKTSLDKINDE